MNNEQYKILIQASAILHKEWDKTKCSEKNAFCSQCIADTIIAGLDDLIDFMNIRPLSLW